MSRINRTDFNCHERAPWIWIHQELFSCWFCTVSQSFDAFPLSTRTTRLRNVYTATKISMNIMSIIREASGARLFLWEILHHIPINRTKILHIAVVVVSSFARNYGTGNSFSSMHMFDFLSRILRRTLADPNRSALVQLFSKFNKRGMSRMQTIV